MHLNVRKKNTLAIVEKNMKNVVVLHNLCLWSLWSHNRDLYVYAALMDLIQLLV